MKIFMFDERETTLKSALESALAETDDYVFVRLNPHLHSSMDNIITIDFICFGKSVNPSLQTRPFANTQDMLETLISRKVPSLAQLARCRLPNNLHLPKHVIDRL